MGKCVSCVCKPTEEEPYLQAESKTEPDQINIWDHPEDSQRLLPAPGNRPHGLMNQGATCYLNSVLQVLFMTSEMHQALETKTDFNETDRVLKKLFAKLKTGPCGTEDLLDHLNIAEHKQRDAAEHLELLLNLLSPDVSEPFNGQITDKTVCYEKHCVHEERSQFWILPLPLENISRRSVMHAFQETFQQTALSGVYCEKCEKKTEAECSCELTKPPQILVLLLKRFDINPTNGDYYKSECEVELSPTLQTQNHKFSLCGVVDHWGSVRGGHYTATVLSTEDHSWYNFNDQTVEQEPAPAGHKSTSAFLLIYRRVSRKNQRRAPQRPPNTGPEGLNI